MSPILDLQNLTPISLEDLGEPKQTNKSLENEITSGDFNITKKETNQTIKTNTDKQEIKPSSDKISEDKPEKKKLVIKKSSKVMARLIAPQQNTDLLLSIKDCETLSGISKVSIRKAIKEKEINYTLEDGKYKISFKELLKWCYSSTRRKNVFNNEGIGRYVNEWKIGI